MLMALVRLQPAYSARLVLDIETQTQGFHASSTAFLEVAEIIRVITAIFLSQTLEAASNDVDIMIQERMRKKSIFVERLEGAGCRVAKPPMTSTKISHLGTSSLLVRFRGIFQAIDESGDGLLSEEEMKLGICSGLPLGLWSMIFWLLLEGSCWVTKRPCFSVGVNLLPWCIRCFLRFWEPSICETRR